MEPHSIKFSQQINTLNRRNFKSPESELANESVYVPKDNFNTPVKGKENVMLNFNQWVSEIK